MDKVIDIEDNQRIGFACFDYSSGSCTDVIDQINDSILDGYSIKKCTLIVLSDKENAKGLRLFVRYSDSYAEFFHLSPVINGNTEQADAFIHRLREIAGRLVHFVPEAQASLPFSSRMGKDIEQLRSLKLKGNEKRLSSLLTQTIS